MSHQRLVERLIYFQPLIQQIFDLQQELKLLPNTPFFSPQSNQLFALSLSLEVLRELKKTLLSSHETVEECAASQFIVVKESPEVLADFMPQIGSTYQKTRGIRLHFRTKDRRKIKELLILGQDTIAPVAHLSRSLPPRTLKKSPHFLPLDPQPPKVPEALRASLLLLGLETPLIVWDKYLVDGYQRYLICLEEGIPYSDRLEWRDYESLEAAKRSRQSLNFVYQKTSRFLQKYEIGKLFEETVQARSAKSLAPKLPKAAIVAELKATYSLSRTTLFVYRTLYRDLQQIERRLIGLGLTPLYQEFFAQLAEGKRSLSTQSLSELAWQKSDRDLVETVNS